MGAPSSVGKGMTPAIDAWTSVDWAQYLGKQAEKKSQHDCNEADRKQFERDTQAYLNMIRKQKPAL